MQCACGMEIKMTKIILASNNKGKIKEVKEICKDMQVEIVSMILKKMVRHLKKTH